MNIQKNEKWREGLRNKPLEYWIRDEIEEIIKSENINRNNFFEVPKNKYESIIHKFYYAFCDYTQYPKIHLEYVWLHLRNNLRALQEVYYRKDWIDYLQAIRHLIPQNNQDESYYLILNQGWVYEVKINELISVLSETDGLLEDFYIISKKFCWFICGCDDGGCMTLFV